MTHNQNLNGRSGGEGVEFIKGSEVVRSARGNPFDRRISMSSVITLITKSIVKRCQAGQSRADVHCIQAGAPLVDDSADLPVESEHHVVGERAELLRVAQAILLVERAAGEGEGEEDGGELSHE